MKRILIITWLLILGCQNYGQTAIDGDGNIYSIISIGDQNWLTTNLKTTKLNDLEPIPLVEDGTQWSILTSPGYCWYDNDEGQYKDTYGALYNWYTVNSDKLCPVGWHVPSKVETAELQTFCGGMPVAGGNLKEEGTEHWNEPNTGATNQFGFTFLPGGKRSYNGSFSNLGYTGGFWTSSYIPENAAIYRSISYDDASFGDYTADVKNGFCVRCIADSALNISIINKRNQLFKVYPDPAQNFVIIEMPESSIPGSVFIYNQSAHIVLQKVITTASINIDISTLSSGIYFVRLITKNDDVVSKIIKQ